MIANPLYHRIYEALYLWPDAFNTKTLYQYLGVGFEEVRNALRVLRADNHIQAQVSRWGERPLVLTKAGEAYYLENR